MSMGNEEDWETGSVRFLACNWEERSFEALSSMDGEEVGWSDFGTFPINDRLCYTTCRTSATIVE